MRTGQWVYWDIFDHPDNWHQKNLDQKTIGQFTGLLDKNGKEIWEGDILLRQGKMEAVEYRGASFGLPCEFIDDTKLDPTTGGYKKSEAMAILVSSFTAGCEVIGNIHENPELLK